MLKSVWNLSDETDAWYPQTHSFAVGLEGSPDLAAAQVVADILEPYITKLNSPFKKDWMPLKM